MTKRKSRVGKAATSTIGELSEASCPNCGLAPFADRCTRCGRPRQLDPTYLHRIEALARGVVHAASDEGTFEVYRDGEQPKTPLQQAITDLAGHIRHWHYPGDGCVNH